MVSIDIQMESLDRLGTLKYFPAKPTVVAAVGKILNELCRDDSEAKRLVDAVLAEFSEWPGPRAIKDLHTAEVASRRAPEVEAKGCSLCCDGFRSAYEIHERMPGRSVHKRIVYPEPQEIVSAFQMEQRLANPNTRVYEVSTYCSCDLGRQRLEIDERRAT